MEKLQFGRSNCYELRILFILFTFVFFTSHPSGARPVYAKDYVVAPKAEWTVCKEDQECEAIARNCEDSFGAVSLNRKFKSEYEQYRKKICDAREKVGETNLPQGDVVLPAGEYKCVKKQCMFVNEQKIKENDHWWSKLKFWE